LHPNDDYVLKVLEEVGLVTHAQIESARSRLNGATKVVDVLTHDGVLSETDVSRALAAQAHMDWIDLSTHLIPADVINQIQSRSRRAG